MMKKAWLGLLLMTTVLGGCLDFLGPDDDEREVRPPDDIVDPSSYSVTAVRVHGTAREPLTIDGFAGDQLRATIYEPVTTDAAPDGGPVAFPVVVFLHPWGNTKDLWQNAPLEDPAPPSQDDPSAPAGSVDLLDRFARAGFISVAYDSRGFGGSEGRVHVAAAPEMADLRAVMDHVATNFHVNGKWGVTGLSYGAGLALRSLHDVANVTTVVPHQPWTDLYDAILPGHVPKAEWSAELYASGQGTSAGRMDPIVTEWLGKAVQRSDLATVEAQMDTRSIAADGLRATTKPLFICQGLEETLFPQIAEAWTSHAGFTRALVHRGGHGTFDNTCWDRTLEWFEFFLLGRDTNVDAWPFLETVDADPARAVVTYTSKAMDIQNERRYLHEGGEEQGFLVRNPSQATFTIEQRVLANPFDVPSGIGDQTGGANQAVPEQLRQDPTAEFFATEAFTGSRVLLGSPTVQLILDDASNGTGFQVVATLFHVDGESGQTRVLTRGAYAHVPGETPELDGTVTIDMHWTKATLGSGDAILLKVGGNDQNVYLQYPSNYSVTFTGASAIDLPFFSP